MVNQPRTKPQLDLSDLRSKITTSFIQYATPDETDNIIDDINYLNDDEQKVLCPIVD